MDDIDLWVRKQRLAMISATINAVHREALMCLAGQQMESKYSALKNEMRHSMDFLSSGNPVAGQMKEALDAIEKLERENYRLMKLTSMARQFDLEEGVCVEWRDKNQWVVSCLGTILSRTGAWIYEPQPSSRTAAFIARTRFSLDEAFARAQLVVEEIRHTSGK